MGKSMKNVFSLVYLVLIFVPERIERIAQENNLSPLAREGGTAKMSQLWVHAASFQWAKFSELDSNLWLCCQYV